MDSSTCNRLVWALPPSLSPNVLIHLVKIHAQVNIRKKQELLSFVTVKPCCGLSPS